MARTLLEFEMLKLSLRGISHPGLIHDRLPLHGPRQDYVPISRASLPGHYQHLENLATGIEFPVVYKIGDEVDYYRTREFMLVPRISGPHIVTCVNNMARGEITIQSRSRTTGEAISTVVSLRNIRRHKRKRAISA